jgi:hypothetical protein
VGEDRWSGVKPENLKVTVLDGSVRRGVALKVSGAAFTRSALLGPCTGSEAMMSSGVARGARALSRSKTQRGER